MRYAYQRDGRPLVSWRTGIPPQSRAADARSLGSLGGTTLDGPTLPAPGAPEPLNVTGHGLGGCVCKGSCGCGTGLSGIAESVPGGYLTLGVAAAAIAWCVFGRKRAR